jgi:hypothetical protein
MTQENKPSGISRDPPPLSSGVQKVTLFEGGGWKAVIECPDSNSGDCANNQEFSGPLVGINEQRRRMNIHRMGVR